MIMNKVWLKNILELVFIASTVKAADFVGINNTYINTPWYPILMFFAVISGISLYAINKDSNEEITINTLFLFIKVFLIDILLKRTFDKESIFPSINDIINQIAIVIIYILLRNPFFQLYKRIGKLAIVNFVIIAIVLLISVLMGLTTIVTTFISFILWVVLTVLTWNYKKN